MTDVNLTYLVGTVSVAASGTVVTGAGGMLWSQSPNVRQWDAISIDGGIPVPIVASPADDTHLTIPTWQGGVKTNVNYVIYQLSPLRFAGGQTMADVDNMLQKLNTDGWYRYVNPAYTDPTAQGLVANEGQFALKYSTGQLWIMTSGVWVLVGIYKGFGVAAPYDNAHTYGLQDVATSGGSSYVFINSTPSAGHAPPNATYWAVLASIGGTGVAGPTGAGYGGSSATSFAIGTGSKAFAGVATNLAYLVGNYVRASSAASGVNFMEGNVTAYSGGTLTINVTKTGGSGTHADWNFQVAGAAGTGDLLSTNNLADVVNPTTSLNNLNGLSFGASQSLTLAQQIQAIENLAILRRNMFLHGIYASKAFGAVRRVVNEFYDGFKATDGIGSSTGLDTTHVAASGFVQPVANAGNDAFTKILLHMDGTNGSSTFTDSNFGASAHVWTAHTATISTAQSEFGGASASFSATGWIDTPDSADFTLGSSNFTFDGWFNASGPGTVRFLAGQIDSGGTNANGAFALYLDSTNKFNAIVYSGAVSTSVTSASTFGTTGWHHFAFVRVGNILRLFIDGTQTGGDVAFSSTVNDSSNKLAIGRLGELTATPFNGFVDEFRLSVGIARWTTTFTPPTSAYTTPVLVTAAQTADASSSNMRGLIELDNTLAGVGGTDFKIEATCDGGTHWTVAGAYTVVSTHGQSGHTIIETDDIACTAGTSPGLRLTVLTGLVLPFYGLAGKWH